MAEEKFTMVALKYHQEVILVLKDDHGASHRQVIRRVRTIAAAKNCRWLKECRQNAAQGDISRWFDDKTPSIWAQVLCELP